jgi:two-component system response regulator DevR
MNVFIADDHPFVRESVAAAVQAEGGSVVGEAESGEDAVARIPGSGARVAVLDIRLPGVSGFEVAEQLRQTAPSVRVLAISARMDDFIHMECERLRLPGFMHKGSLNSASLRAALVAVAGGRTYYCPRYQSFREKINSDAQAVRRLLTPTELRVLALVGLGHDDERIAAELGSARGTVAKHRGNLLHKLGLPGSPQLVRYAIEHVYRDQGGDIVK